MDDVHMRELIAQQNRALTSLARHFVPDAEERREKRWRLFITKLVAITGVTISGFFAGWEFFQFMEQRSEMRYMASRYAEVAREIYFQENNADVAQDFLEKAIELEGGNSEYRYLQAFIEGSAAVRTLMNLDRPFTKEEMDLAHNAVAYAILLDRLSSERPEPHILKGQAYSALGQNDRAMTELKAAIGIDPANDFAHVRLAMVLSEEGKTDEALREIDAALALNPKSKWAWLWKGVVHADLQSDWSGAREAYAKALESDDRFDLAYYNLAWTYLKQEPRDYAEARRLFEKALSCEPNYKEAYYGLGMVYGYQDLYEQAKVYLDKAIALDERFLTALKWRGIVQYETENYDDALSDFTQALELSPTDAELYVRRARVHEKMNTVDRAIADLRFAVELDAKDQRTWLYLGDIFLNVGECEKALGYYARALEIDPAYAEAYGQVAAAHEKLGRFDEARAALDQAVQSVDYRPDRFLVKRGLFLKNHELWADALSDFQTARNTAEDNLAAWTEEALVLAKLGRKQEALDAINRAIDLKPQDAELQTMRDSIGTLP